MMGKKKQAKKVANATVKKKTPKKVVKKKNAHGGGGVVAAMGGQSLFAGASVGSEIILPSQSSVLVKDLGRDTITIYGIPGVGKTRLAAEFPGCLVLDLEHGSDMYDVHRINIEKYAQLLGTITTLERGDHDFKTVAIDPIEKAYRLAEDWTTENLLGGVHPGEANDRGKSWKVLRDAFEQIFDRIRNAGLGLINLSHVREAQINHPGAEPYDAIRPDTTPACWSTVNSKSSHIWFYGKELDGTRSITVTGPGWMVSKTRVDDNFRTTAGRPVLSINAGSSSKAAYANLMAAYNGQQVSATATVRKVAGKKVVKKKAS